MSGYRDYMDRQHVSQDLHSRILALEEEQIPSGQQNVTPFRRWAALAACLCLVAGLGWFGLRHLPVGMGGNMAADSAAPTEDCAPEETEDVADSEGQYAYSQEESAVMEEAAEEPAAALPEDAAPELPAQDSASEEVEDEVANLEAEENDGSVYLNTIAPDGCKLISFEEGEDTCILIWETEEGSRLTLQYIEEATETKRGGLSGQGYPIYTAESGDWKDPEGIRSGEQGWGFVIERAGGLEVYTTDSAPERLPELAEAVTAALG